MKIVHIKQSKLAFAPDIISDHINKYSEHTSVLMPLNRIRKYPDLCKDADIIHLHNKNALKDFPNRIIQYHSEPKRVDLNVSIPSLVIAQYHATLDAYKNCRIVRNPIDIYNKIFTSTPNTKSIRIGFSPSIWLKRNRWYDKGAVETNQIMQRIREKHKVDIDVIHNVGLDECLKRKSKCNIIIDEVKTGSYHRSGLEGLAFGALTICRIMPSLEKIIKDVSGADTVPFVSCNMQELEDRLSEIIEKGIDYVLDQGKQSRLWMEKYWNPKNLTQEYIDIYESVKF